MTPTLAGATAFDATLYPYHHDIIEMNVAWLNNPAVVRFSEQRHKTHTVASQRKYAASFDGETSHLWSISTRSEVVGTLAAHIDGRNGTAEVGIMIGDTEYWHCGIGASAWKVACDWLLTPVGNARKIEAGCMAKNTGMHKIFKKTGMIVEGRRRGHFMLDHMPVDLLMYGRFR